jgi:hypothetical protein
MRIIPQYTFGSVFGLSIIVAGLAVAAPANATVWRNYAGENYVLSVENNTTSEGQPIVIQVFSSGLATQIWTENLDPGTGYYTFFSQLTPPPTSFPLVMGVAAGTPNNGTALVDWDSDGTLNQNWSIVPLFADSSGHECYVFVDAASPAGKTRVAGVSAGVIQQNRPVITWDYFGDKAGHPDQFWCAY